MFMFEVYVKCHFVLNVNCHFVLYVNCKEEVGITFSPAIRKGGVMCTPTCQRLQTGID